MITCRPCRSLSIINGAGDILAMLTYEAAQLSGFITGTLLQMIPQLLTVAGAVFVLFRTDLLLGVMIAVLIPLFYLLLKIIGRRLRPLASQLQAEHAAAVGIAEENLGMLPAIKTFTREPGIATLSQADFAHLSPQHDRA